MSLTIKPMIIREADKFVTDNHRHNKARGNGKFAISCYNGDELVGVAIAGRPSSRHEDDGETLEIYRVCTSGYKNATSLLYSRCKRIGQLMGYTKFMTYTLQSESGSSLKGLGAHVDKWVNHKKQWNDYVDPDGKKTKRNVQTVTVAPKFRWRL